MEVIRVTSKSKLIQNEFLIRNEKGERIDTLEYLTFPGLSKINCISHLFSTRLGGVSRDHLSSMNLSYSRGDDPENVTENFRRIASVFGKTEGDIVCTDQTHTINVRVATKEDAGKGITKERDYTDIDGQITNEKGIILSAFFADCVPLYFVDPVKEVIGLSHSGWRGTVAGMGAETIRKMQTVYGCDPKDIHVAIGPSICQECYEVSSEVYDAFAEQFASDRDALQKVFYQKDDWQRSEGKYQMDLWKANELIMLRAGILPEHIEITDLCTAHNPEYLFSHRKTNGKRGNLGAFLMLND